MESTHGGPILVQAFDASDGCFRDEQSRNTHEADNFPKSLTCSNLMVAGSGYFRIAVSRCRGTVRSGFSPGYPAALWASPGLRSGPWREPLERGFMI
jgi:hypothetical protein